MKKKVLSAILTLSMLTSLISTALPVAAAGAVEYESIIPEIAILNIEMAGSSQFYQTIVNEKSPYNAYKSLYGGSFSSEIKTDGKTLKWGGFNKSNLRKIAGAKYKNLYGNVSGDFYNNIHKHTWGNIFKKYSQEVVDYAGMSLEFGNMNAGSAYGSQSAWTKNYRDGNNRYAAIYCYDCSDTSKNLESTIEFKQPNTDYDSGKKTCTHSEGSVKKVVVSFADLSAPTVNNVKILKKGASGNNDSMFFVAGDTVVIEVIFDEPVRFADDSNLHDDLYVGLQLTGAVTNPKAMLKSLKNNVMTFEYTVPEDLGEYRVANIDLQPLYGKDLPLKHIGAGGSVVSVTPPSEKEKAGYTTTTSYITDISGNALLPISESTNLVPVQFYLDTVHPFVTKIVTIPTTKNASVKQALGKTDVSANDYRDASDINLGAGDAIGYRIYLNETVTSKEGTANIKLKAETNLLDENGNRIVLTSSSNGRNPAASVGEQYGRAASNGYVTAFTFDPIGIEKSYRIIDDEGNITSDTTQIKVVNAYLSEESNPTDPCGNAPATVQFNSQSVGQDTYYLDLQAPIAEFSDEQGGKITPTPTGNGREIRIAFKLDDSKLITPTGENAPVPNGQTLEGRVNGGSGVNGLMGYFIIADEENKWGNYKYAVTARGESPSENQYQDGYFGNVSYFTMIEGNELYLYIKPDETWSYFELFDPYILIFGKDYAGNQYLFDTEGEINKRELDWMLDTKVPDIMRGNVTKALDSTGESGTLSVEITTSDAGGLKRIDYLWGDQEKPDEADGGWQSLSLTENSTQSVNKVMQTVEIGENFSKYLWIKAEDMSNNVLIMQCGQHNYNLSNVTYELDYTSAITAGAELTLKNQIDGNMAVLFPAEPGSESNSYYLQMMNGYNYNIFLDRSKWVQVTMEQEGSTYNFTQVPIEDYTYIDSIIYRTFSGEIPVTILTVNSEGCDYPGTENKFYFGDASYPVSKEELVLRVSSEYNNAVPSFNLDNTKLEVVSDGLGYSGDGIYGIDDPAVPSTLAGHQLKVTLGEPTHIWGYEDIDWEESHILLSTKRNTDPRPVEYKVPLTPNQSVQYVTLPDETYKTGWWTINLNIIGTTGRKYVPIPVIGEGIDGSIFIDSTPTIDDFGFSMLMSKPYSITSQFPEEYNEYIDKNLLTDDETIHLPIPARSFVSSIQYKIYFDQKDIYGNEVLPMRYTNENGVYGYEGDFIFKIWNITAGQTADQAVEFDRTDINTNTHNLYFEHINEGGTQFTDDVPLIRGKENTIAMQIYSSNGNVSAVKTYTIYPVVTEISGTLTSDSTEYAGTTSSVSSQNKLIFTPDEGVDMIDANMFAIVRRTPTAEIEKYSYFEAQADGTYVMPLEEGHRFYEIYAIDRYGGIKLIEDAYFKAMLDTQAPTLTANSILVQDGIFEAEFAIEDTSFTGKQWYISDTTVDPEKDVPLPMELQFSFTGDYAKRLEEGENQTLTLTPEFAPCPAANSFETWSWNADSISKTGIFEVTANMESDFSYHNYTNTGKMVVTVKGLLKEDMNDTQPFDLNLKLTATDYFGYTEEIEATKAQVTATGARHIKDGPLAPVRAFHIDDNKLIVNFNSPVKPKESWANINPVYGMEQADGFPVAADGKYEIEYYDIFGDLVVDEIEIINQFGDYGLFIDYSPTTPTSDEVTITIRHADPEVGRYMKVWQKTGENNNISIPPHGQTEFTLTADANGTYFVSMYASSVEGNSDSQSWNGDETYIYVNNIVAGAPDAELKFYFEEYGTEYTIDNLPQGETESYVKVWYDTERNTTPTNNTEAEIKFEAGGIDSYTFQYVDDFGNSGSATVDLSELGVTLVRPAEPIPDTSAPRVYLGVNSKRFGAYTEEDSIVGEADIARALYDVSYVQGYSMKVNVDDDSAYKIVLLAEEPSSMSYSSAQSVDVEGVTLTGNIVKIEKPQNFTIAVVDNADNFSYISFAATDFDPYFDTTAPTPIPEITASNLYERTLYMSFEDKLDNGTVIPDNTMVTYPNMTKITNPESSQYGKFSMNYADNATETIRFSDYVGNSGSYSAVISGINNDEPTLTTVWSPPYVERDAEGNTIRIDQSAPTKDPVNKPITAKITSDIPVQSATMEYSVDDGRNWTVFDPDAPDSVVSMDFATDIITVTFKAGNSHARVVVTAPNGKQGVAYLMVDEGLIDVGLTYSVEYKDLTRDGATVPYGKEVLIETFEPVRYSEGINKAMLYNQYNSITGEYDVNPLKFRFVESGSHKITLTDLAGNVKVVNIDIGGVDMTSPIITTNPEDTLSLPLTNGSVQVGIAVDEKATVKINGSSEIFESLVEKIKTFTQNGIYDITATDDAGNVSYSTISVGNIDNIVPSISFIKTTISVKQDTAVEDIRTMLEENVTVWDNLDKEIVWSYDMSQLNPAVVGVYPVTFTATDDAGNTGTAVRYVKIYDKNIPSIYIDGEMAEDGGTTVVDIGTHTITVNGLKQIAAGIDEPYAVKIKKGMCTEAQMKYYLSGVVIDNNGQFTLTESGFYTVYVITQSRQSFRTLLYVE